MGIEKIRIKNYRVLKDLEIDDLGGVCLFVGANGTGKSTLFDVFGFLHDCLLHNVRQALARRGGFNEVRSRGQHGPIEIELKFRPERGIPPVTYQLIVDIENGAPIVYREVLRQRRGSAGKPWHFLDFSRGTGTAVLNDQDYGSANATPNRESQSLDSPDLLAIKGLGQFQKFKYISMFRKLIEDWHVSDFHISDARPSQESGHAEHLSERGDNLPLVAQFLYETKPDIFKTILQKMQRRVPGVTEVEPVQTADGRLVLRFQDGSFKDPFVARFVSDGTIKMFAYLLLLHDPKPHPLLCIEEPENQLYPELLQELFEEFRAYNRSDGQVFVSTHSPDLLNAAQPKEVYVLSKQQGFTRVDRLIDNKLVVELHKEGDQLGYLWRQGFFGGVSKR